MASEIGPDDNVLLSTPDQGDELERSTSAEPAISTIKEPAPLAVEEVEQSLPPASMDIEKRIRNVLNSRPSVRMASRHQLLSPLHEDLFTRDDPVRHTLPVKSTLERKKTQFVDPKLVDPSVRRRQLQKASFLSSNDLGQGFPLQRRSSKGNQKDLSSLIIKHSATNVSDTTMNQPLTADSPSPSPVVPEVVVVQDLEPKEDSITTIPIVTTGEEDQQPSEAQPKEDVISIPDDVPMKSLERTSELRKSTMHLKHRMLRHRHTMDQLDQRRISVRTGFYADFKYVKWPKIKSWLLVQMSRRLWRNHLKEVEGHFGTAVVSYFIFLRWLFIMNLLIFMLWFSFICIPEIVYISTVAINATTSLTSCAFITPSIDNNTCSGNSRTVYSIPDNCSSSQLEQVFDVGTCSFNDDGVAVKESSSVIVVTGLLYQSDCTVADTDTSVPNITTYTLCANVDPFVEWYTYVTDFISGTGLFNETLLFHGIYPNASLGNFSFDLAFLIMVGLIYVVSMILLIYKMGQAFNESYVEFGRKRKVNFCNKLFTAWDFNITNPKTADLKKAHIKIDFQEELADINAREKERTKKELAIVILIRICTNTFVIVSLGLAGAAIYYSAQFELLVANGEVDFPVIGGYLSSIIISLLNAVYPFMFALIANFEKYQTATESVIITLLRTILVRLASLLVLLSSLYTVISSCTRVVPDSEDDPSASECTFATLTGNIISTNETLSADETCPVCWETFIGQQFFRLALTNLAVALGATILVETGRNFSAYIVKKVHFKYQRVEQLLKKVVKRGNFNITKSILDLIYTQSLLWLGFLFSPLLPTIILLTSFCLFYVKKYSLLYNLDPDKKGFARSARTNFMFLLLMLLALFASAIPVLYAVTTLKPSENCGPFRGQDTMYESITILIDRWSCPVQITVDFFTSAAFVVPLVILLLLLVYALYVILKAREARFQLIKKQLVLEGANVTHIVGHLDTVLQQLAEERAQQVGGDNSNRFSSQNQHYLDDIIKRYSKLNVAATDGKHSSTLLDDTYF